MTNQNELAVASSATGSNEWVDFRSDTCTLPTKQMLNAMVDLDPTSNEWTFGVGDAVYGDDETVHRLEAEAAQIMGKDAALYCPTGTMANLIAIMTHCARGEEYITGQYCHVHKWEAGGAAALGSCVPQPVEHLADGSLNLDLVERYIKPDDFHHAQARLISVENPISGKAWSLDKMKAVKDLADKRGLKVHLDGARIFNGAVALGCNVKDMTQYADSVMFCLSKSLCAPVGSLLVGSTEFIARAKRYWKQLGGGWRQAGVLAAAGRVALHVMPARLEEDHAAARRFAVGLIALLTKYGIDSQVDMETVQTNMVLVKFPLDLELARMKSFMFKKHIKINAWKTTRFVFHHGNCSEKSVDQLLQSLDDYFQEWKNREHNF